LSIAEQRVVGFILAWSLAFLHFLVFSAEVNKENSDGEVGEN